MKLSISDHVINTLIKHSLFLIFIIRW